MKLVRSEFQPDGSGSVKMIPEESDDLWVAYNLILPGDTVTASTVRKVVRQSSCGNREAVRVKLTLQIAVENTEYDKEGSALRIQGKNVLENEHVRIGAFHTLEIELKRPFVLMKGCWDEVAHESLRQASDPTSSANLAVVLMQEGTAQIHLIGKSVTVSRPRIEVAVPRKHGPSVAGYDAAVEKFFSHVVQSFKMHIDFEVVRCVVIASPGFTKDQFLRYLLLEAERSKLRPIIENKARIILAHTNSGYKHSLREVLADPTVMNSVKDTKAAKEVQALKQFFAMMTSNPDRACYGPTHVEVAHERMAVQTLLITDELFRNADVAARRRYSELVKSVRGLGGDVFIFSTMHASGEQLQQLTGVAAILRFPLPELDDIEM